MDLQELGDGSMDGGASCSSLEASKDRGAKNWQIAKAKERNL